MKILKFNELAGNTYKSAMDKVRDKSDPRSFRIYSDAKKLRSQYYLPPAREKDPLMPDYKFVTQKPLNIQLKNGEIISFILDDISYENGTLILTGIKENKQIILYFAVNTYNITYEDSNSKSTAYVDRKGANVISKILKDYGVEVKPQDIPQM